MGTTDKLKDPRQWWESYASGYPPNVSRVQIDETKKAFIAGMLATLETLKKIGDSDVSESEGTAFLDKYNAMLNNMVEEMVAGERVQ